MSWRQGRPAMAVVSLFTSFCLPDFVSPPQLQAVTFNLKVSLLPPNCFALNSKLLDEGAYRHEKHRDWLLDQSLELVMEVKLRLSSQ